jgi:hypothetical protein
LCYKIVCVSTSSRSCSFCTYLIWRCFHAAFLRPFHIRGQLLPTFPLQYAFAFFLVLSVAVLPLHSLCVGASFLSLSLAVPQLRWHCACEIVLLLSASVLLSRLLFVCDSFLPLSACVLQFHLHCCCDFVAPFAVPPLARRGPQNQFLHFALRWLPPRQVVFDP